jgi:hypothetical protein
VTIVFIAKYLFTGSVKILNKIVFKIAIKFISVRNPEISYCLYSTVYIHNGTFGMNIEGYAILGEQVTDPL